MTITDADMQSLAAHRIDCPIPWCIGRVLDHGANGSEPEHWLHEGEDEDVAGIATGSFVAIGSDAPRYSIAPDLPGADVLLNAYGLRDLATRFRAAAAILDERSTALEAQR